MSPRSRHIRYSELDAPARATGDGTNDPSYERELLRIVTDALQDTRILAVVSWEGDHWYAEDAGLDARAILTKARDALEEAEEHLAALANPEART